MFEQSSLSKPIAATRACSTAIGLVTQSVLITAAVLVPLVSPDALPRVHNMIGIFAPPSPPPPPPPAARPAQLPRASLRPLQMQGTHLIAPVAIPARPVMIDEPPLTPQETGVPGGAESGVPGGIAGGTGAILSALTSALPATTQPVAPAAAEPKPASSVPVRIRRGGQVQEGMLLHKVIPNYPALARAARVSGVVRLLGVVGTDGRIRELRVESGHPLLVNAALEAVRQWIYRPTMLNGEAVEVVAPIIVTFTLG
ncbi:MAG TPA: energy transducer TonB [Bryobacteraceae bacterium]|jgi:protein TonB|nr:energy transducer TonB [Bryobacteraceae bacterium]